MADLIVELYGTRGGRLVGRDWRTFDFVADRTAFTRFQLGSTVMAESTARTACGTGREGHEHPGHGCAFCPFRPVQHDSKSATAPHKSLGLFTFDRVDRLGKAGITAVPKVFGHRSSQAQDGRRRRAA